ncbi:KTSC domain-containing protein [Chitinophaga parva]|uniref:KTSC domain-containing protein n=1 Tax=Chitinophaga parva TaxID=2169414 RepID=A0A2T7BD59_9BACT|nr:KTSC domain-containing protein [Chitinophaga parva]PUZ23031.1 KTSC domain-containing protein [Chitinophaga parva]
MPSTVIAHIAYLPEVSTLRITFTSQKVYDYLEVPPAVYEAMKASRIKGIYFNQYIKNRYACRLVSTPGQDLFSHANEL